MWVLKFRRLLSQWSKKNGHELWASQIRDDVPIVNSCYREIRDRKPNFNTDDEDVLEKEQAPCGEKTVEKEVGGGVGKRACLGIQPIHSE